MKTCSKCGLTLRGSDQEGDICLTCLSSLTPHCNFDQGYSTIEGAIRQSTKQPIEKHKPMIEEEIYSGVNDDGIEIMLRKLDETSWIVDVRLTEDETDEYLEGYEYEKYLDAFNQYETLCKQR